MIENLYVVKDLGVKNEYSIQLYLANILQHLWKICTFNNLQWYFVGVDENLDNVVTV